MFSRWKSDKRAAALDQLWDQLQAADGSRRFGATERPADAETIAAVLAHDDAPSIDPVFSAILLKDLTNMHAQQRFGLSSNGHGTAAISAQRSPIVRQPSWFGEQHAGTGPRWIRLAAGLAVLAVLLAVGALTLMPERSPEPPVIPAAVVQDEGQIESVTLLDISFPPGRMRGDEGARVIFGEHSIAPGMTAEFGLACDSVGVHPLYVLDGTLSVDALATSFVLRSGAAEWETIPAGEPVDVRAGDTWFVENPTKDGVANLRNDGAGEVRYLWVGLRENAPECSTAPPSGQQIDWSYLEDPAGPIDPTQPVRLVLRTVTVPAGSEMSGEIGGFPIPSVEQEAMGARQWAKILSGALVVTRENDGQGDPVTAEWAASTVATQDTIRSSDGAVVTISNESDRPVELMVLDIVVGDPEAQGGVTAPPAASSETDA
ncbi:MAG: hypothetical protein R2855_18755 [Thermomicrobiales bacterium]